MKKSIVLILKLGALGLCIMTSSHIAHYFCQNSIHKNIIPNDTLIVGTSADYPPYALIDLQTNEIIGFDIDIATEVAARLHKKCIVKDMPFNTLIFELVYGQIDMIAAGLTPNERRGKKVLFSRSYLDSDPLVVITRKDTVAITDLAQLHGKPVAVNLGYTADMYLTKDHQMTLVRLDTPADGIMALQSGSVDAFVCAQSSLSRYLATRSDHDFQFFTITTAADSYALALAHHNIQLKYEVDCALASMEKDGTLDTLKIKWNI